MSNMFEKIKFYYTNGMWKKWMVADAVVKGQITAEEYKEITGKTYCDK